MIKIYTYANPYKITGAPFWPKIEKMPHLCVSQTLVQGLRSLYGLKSFWFIDTIEKFLESFYGSWLNKPENDIMQYLSLSDAIEQVPQLELQRTLKFNQREMLDAARFLLELGVDLNSFDINKLSPEQQAFLEILKNISQRPEWQAVNHLDQLTIEEFKDAILDLFNEQVQHSKETAKKESKSLGGNKKSNYQILKERHEDFDKNIDQVNIEGVVLHGVHQFTPLILKFVNLLNRLGLEVIFLFNYHKDYQRIYATWQAVYAWVKEEFTTEASTFPCNNRLGEGIGKLLEGQMQAGPYPKVSYIKYDNLTTFADHISHLFNRANNDLSKMQEQFYATDNSQANELLKAYFPQQFGEKHFLSYPIGQFILGLYNMWNEREQSLILNEKTLKECLAVNFFREVGQPNPVEIYNKIQLFFNDVDDLDSFIMRLEQLLQTVKELETGTCDGRLQDLSKVSFYNLNYNELYYFQRVIRQLRDITQELFGHNSGRLDYKLHYKKLLEIISNRALKSKFITDKERELVEAIRSKFDNIDDLEVQGSVEDLKETIHFYLNRRNSNESANWIVRNFEQIDGGVLLSKTKGGPNKIYHLALVSNQKMSRKLNELLKWPLNEAFFQAGSRPKDLDIVLKCLKEYGNFLRYSIFYACYYLANDIHISYIEQNQDNEQDTPYFILEMLGLKPEDFNTAIIHAFNVGGSVNNISDQKTTDIVLPADILELQTFTLCPYRYLMDCILERSSYHQGDYHIRLFYQSLLLKNAWIALEGQECQRIATVIEEENNFLRDFFPFWQNIDFQDIQNRVVQQLATMHVDENGKVKAVDDYYVNLRLNFLYASIKDNWNDGENLIRRIHRGHLNEREAQHGIAAYILGEEQQYKVHPMICNHCKEREVCLNYFKEGDSHS